jgi:hypothetical protein
MGDVRQAALGIDRRAGREIDCGTILTDSFPEQLRISP